MEKEETKAEVVIDDLKPGERTVKKLDHGGHLFLEHDIPFLVIYRYKPKDKATMRLARTGASYLIIGKNHFDYFQEVVNQLNQKMSKRFGAFILIEIYSGPAESTEFVIRGPSHKLSVSLDVLRNELQQVESQKKDGQPLTARIEQTRNRLNPQQKEFFSIDELKGSGCTFIGLEIPPVYRNKESNIYPLYFRKFRTGFAKALHKAVLEFIRIQTSSDLQSYSALGKRQVHKELFKIDKGLTKIENAYQFLLLIAPVNIQSIKKYFFKTNFEKVKPYHYRLLPIDPDLLKRQLYDLRIDEIDDPALAFLFEEKREEIDQELTMLKERGSKDFFYSSLHLYKGIGKNTLKEAELILKNVPEDAAQQKGKVLSAHAFAELAEKEFDYFRQQSSDFHSQVHIRSDVNVIMVSNGELYLPSDYTMTKKEAAALIQHEIGTHTLTYYNGIQQPLTQLSQGLAGYDSLQEGLAVLAEYLIGGLTANRLRILAGRVIAGDALLDDAEFKEVFNLLHLTYGFSKEPAFNITSRTFQGSGFLKDVVYLRGLLNLRKYLQKNGNLEFLLSGKFALEHVPLIKDLTDRKILHPPKIKPRYLKNKDFDKRMSNLRNGIALSKMI